MVVPERIVSWCDYVVTPRMQIIFFCITTLLALGIAYPRLKDFYTTEPSPQLLPITLQKIKEWGGNPTEVRVGFHITNVPQFEMDTNKFTVDGIIWFEFDSSLVSLETIEKFSFEKGTIIKRSEADTKIINGKLFAQYNITVSFVSNIIYTFFPFDDHRLYLALMNKHLSPHEVMYTADISGFLLSPHIFVPGWGAVNWAVRTGYSEEILDEHDARKTVINPKVVFSMDFKRLSTRDMLLIFVPLFLIFFVGLFAFSLSDTSAVLSLASSAIASMITYRFTLQNMSPKSGYFMLSDQIFTLFLVFAFCAFLIAIFLRRQRDTIVPKLVILRGVAFLGFHVGVIACWTYLLYFWAR